jgi:hypothetical protein
MLVVVGLRVVYKGVEKGEVLGLKVTVVKDVTVTMEEVDLGAIREDGEPLMGGIIAMLVLMCGGYFVADCGPCSDRQNSSERVLLSKERQGVTVRARR